MAQETHGVAIVTGGGSGIGRASALQLAEDGFAVLVVDVDNEKVRETQELLASRNFKCDFACIDLTDEAAQEAALRDVRHVQVLVNSAGVFWTKRVEHLQRTDFERQFAMNVTALFTFSMRVVNLMQAGARIINLSSRGAYGGKSMAHYSSAKAAVIGLTRSLALELAPRQITVNAIAPGVVLTPMLLNRGEALDKLASELPLGRLGTPEDIAHAVSYFADPRAGFVTGQTLTIDGGRSIGDASVF